MREMPLKDRNGRVMRFDNYGEFIKAALGPSEMEDDQRSSRETEKDEFHGGSWATAKRLGIAGDAETALLMRKEMIREANKMVGEVSRFDPVFKADGGIWIDVGRYLSGEPEAWGDMVNQDQERRARQVTIAFGAGVNCMISARDYERAAIAVGGAVLGLKASGVAVSLYACYKNSAWGSDCDITAINMTPGGAFDVSRLAALTRTWFFRRLVFSWWETRDKKYRESHGVYISGGYGRSEPLGLRDAKDICGKDNTLILNVSEMVGQSSERIRKIILDSMKQKVLT